MKSNNISILALLLLSLVACEKVQEEESVSFLKDKVFYAETPSGDATKTYLNGELQVLWNADDRLSVFRSTTNERYRFDGEDGETRNAFHKDDESVPGEAFPRNYAVYPYLSGTSCTEEGILSVSLPATQSYTAGSFGRDANTMVAATYNYVDDYFHFKNVGSYLRLQLYGGDRIRSIKFFGNSGEKIAGKASITVDTYNAPLIAMSKEATTEITLDCGEAGVATPEDVSDAIPFWIVLPATSFSGGFTVEVTNTSGAKLIKSTTHPQTFAQNTVKTMVPVKMDTQSSKEMLSFSLSDGVSKYDAFNISDDYIDVQVPSGTDMNNLIATFTYNGSKVTVNDIPQSSGVDAHDYGDFTNPIQFVVHSILGTSRTYTVRMFNLPIVFIESPAPITSKTVWVDNCSFIVREADGTITDYQATSLKGRGNSTWTRTPLKKPYNVKFATNPSKQNPAKPTVFGMPSHKKWCLLDCDLGQYYPNAIGFELARRTASLGWASHGVFVEVFLNGTYKGLYYFTEKIEIDKNRLNIKEMSSSDISDATISGGYLLSFDTTFDEVNKFHSQYYNMPVMFKEPDEDVLVADQFNYLQDYVNNFEASLKDDERFSKREYLDYIDIDSFIDYYFVWEMAGDLPTYIVGYSDFNQPRSVYYHKDRGGKLKGGPVWDFNGHLFYRQVIICNKSKYYGRLFQDPYFVARVKEKWPDFVARVKGEKDGFPSILSVLEDVHNSISASSERDWLMFDWQHVYKPKPEYAIEPSIQYNTIKDGIYGKLDYLSNYFNSLVVTYDNKGAGTEDFGNQQNPDFGFEF